MTTPQQDAITDLMMGGEAHPTGFRGRKPYVAPKNVTKFRRGRRSTSG